MFAKITTGSLAAGLINYMDNVKEKDARILIAKGLCAVSHEAICASFEIQASRNHSISEKMLHISLAFSENDGHRTMSDEFMTAFALDYLKRMGWDNTQLIIVRHDDHDYDHIHMALNVIDNDGKPLDLKFYKTRSQRTCFKMTKEYGLYFAKDKKNVNRSALKGKDKLKYEIADTAMPLLGKCKSLAEFREALAKKGITTTIVPTRDGKGLGIVYTIKDKKFSIGGAKLDQEQLNQTKNNMPPKKKKSKTAEKKAIANMGANMAAMMSPASPVIDSQSITNPVQDVKVQSAESAECNDIPEAETSSEPVGGSEMDPPTPIEVNIDIEKTQGNAIYSSLLGLQNTLDYYCPLNHNSPSPTP